MSEIISINFGKKWIEELLARLIKIQKSKSKELDRISEILYGDPFELAKYYIEPDCQQVNTADHPIDNFLMNREPIFKKIQDFFRTDASFQEGNNQLFFLADAGMGKSSLLMMLKLTHLTSFWPKSHSTSGRAGGLNL